jgi:integrase
MNTVEPIRDPRKIAAIKNILKTENPRDFALFTLGINTALRVGDLLGLKVKDVLDKRGNIFESLYLREQKTKQEKVIRFNRPAREALDTYLSKVPELDYNDALFPGRNKKKPLTRIQVYRLIQQWCELVGLTEGRYGAHTLRKTWGYQARKRGEPLEIIQAKLGHRSPAVTRRYIGITQDEIGDVEERVEL